MNKRLRCTLTAHNFFNGVRDQAEITVLTLTKLTTKAPML